jgi:hypothetical protein
LKTIYLLFFYMSREWRFDLTWNYKKWGHPMGCGSSHLCLCSCWDILYEIGDLLELCEIAKVSQMLMGTENIMYKGKSLHVHRNKNNNNNNHILENSKYNHCFLIHLNYFILFYKYKTHTNPWPNSKGQRPFFSKNIQNCHF